MTPELVDRRDFLKIASQIAILFGLESSAVGNLVAAVEEVSSGNAPVLWLQGQSCSGCSISLLNSYPRIPLHVLTRDISLKFHQTLSTASGHKAVEAIETVVEKEGFILVIEGSIPIGIPEACMFAHEPFQDQLKRIIPKCKAIIAVGACAAFGGIPAAEGNPTGAMSVRNFLKKEGFKTPLVTVPGCPPHPDWMVGTIVHILKFGIPSLNKDLSPLMFFRHTVHEQCPRFPFYERKQYANQFGDPGCLFKLGCQGPITHADCTIRKWNGGVNDCIQCGSGCVGCASPDFPRGKNFPFYYNVGRA